MVSQVEAEDGTPAKDKEGEDKTVLLMHEATNKKWNSFRTRTLSTVFMLGGFVSVIYFGHVFVWALVVLIQVRRFGRCMGPSTCQLPSSTGDALRDVPRLSQLLGVTTTA
jgi:hypothetical protein